MERRYRSALRRMSGAAPVASPTSVAQRAEVLRQMISSTDPACMILLKENLLALESEQPPAGEQISEGPATLKFAQNGFALLEKEFLETMDETHHRWEEHFALSHLLGLLRKGGWLEENGGQWQLVVGSSQRETKELFSQMMRHLSSDIEKNLVVVLSRAQHLQERIAKQWYGETVRCSQTRLFPTLELSLRSGEAELLRTMRDQVGQLALAHFQTGLRKSRQQRWSSAEALCRMVGGATWNGLRVWESGWRGFFEDYLNLARGLGVEFLQWYRTKWNLFLRGYAQGQLDLFRASSAP